MNTAVGLPPFPQPIPWTINTESCTLEERIIKPRKPHVYVSLDLECTGLDMQRNGIVQIGAWATGETENDFKDYFVSDCNPHYLHPEARGPLAIRIDKEALAVNGFTLERIDQAPELGVVLHKFHAWLKKWVDAEIIVVGQNVPFDISWLKKNFTEMGMDNDSFRRVIDNASLGFAAYGEMLGQAKLADRLGMKYGNAHDALVDAYMASRIFHALRKKLNIP